MKKYFLIIVITFITIFSIRKNDNILINVKPYNMLSSYYEVEEECKGISCAKCVYNSTVDDSYLVMELYDRITSADRYTSAKIITIKNSKNSQADVEMGRKITITKFLEYELMNNNNNFVCPSELYYNGKDKKNQIYALSDKQKNGKEYSNIQFRDFDKYQLNTNEVYNNNIKIRNNLIHNYCSYDIEQSAITNNATIYLWFDLNGIFRYDNNYSEEMIHKFNKNTKLSQEGGQIVSTLDNLGDTYQVKFAEEGNLNIDYFEKSCPRLEIKCKDDWGIKCELYLDKDQPEPEVEPGLPIKTDCGLLGDKTNPQDEAYWIQQTLNIIKYIAIVLILVLSIIDFVKAFVSQDASAIKKAYTTAFKRLIFAVLIFFIPIIVEMIMDLIGAYGTCGIN